MMYDKWFQLLAHCRDSDLSIVPDAGYLSSRIE